MTLEHEIMALRTSVGFHRADEMICLRFSGPDAYETIDWLCPTEFYLRHSQMRHTLFLDEQAVPVANLYVACQEEDFLVLFEGANRVDLNAHLQAHLPAEHRTIITSLSDSHQVISLDGPFAWELLAEIVGAEIIGLPYLTFAQLDSLLCFRAGSTGEYGYYLLVPHSAAAEMENRLVDIGQKFELARVGLPALEQCALENFFFNIKREGRAGVSPIELQLQWRVSYRKKYVGAESLAQRRRQGAATRLTALVGGEEISTGDLIYCDELPIGEVFNAGFSHVRGDWVALALLKIEYAYPGIRRYLGEHAGRRFPIRTVTPPVINNRSLHISPQTHSFAARAQYLFPSLVI